MLLGCSSCINEPWAIAMKSVASILARDDDTMLFRGLESLDASQTRKDLVME